MLSSTALTYLCISNDDVAIFDAPAAALLSAALRANRTLQDLLLLYCELWSDTQAATELLSALTGHASISFLHLALQSAPVSAEAIGTALGALVAANAPALTDLSVADCSLGDVGTGPLVDALAQNTHLRVLDIWDNDISAEFAAERLLPAVRANTSLCELDLRYGDESDEPEAVLEARELVRAQAAARQAAQAAAEPGGA